MLAEIKIRKYNLKIIFSYNETMKINFVIKKMAEKDRDEVFSMMKTFYSSNAVLTCGSDEIFRNDIENCINENPYLEGFVFVSGENTIGYSMIAKSFSTEFGKSCIWFEDLYLKPEFRGCGVIPEFINYIKTKYPQAVYRLEAENENKHAVHVYKKSGFEILPYIEMVNNCF